MNRNTLKTRGLEILLCFMVHVLVAGISLAACQNPGPEHIDARGAVLCEALDDKVMHPPVELSPFLFSPSTPPMFHISFPQETPSFPFVPRALLSSRAPPV